jgi:hypothetical protein
MHAMASPPTRPWVRLSIVFGIAAVVTCGEPQAAARQRLAGEYVREMDGGPVGRWHVRQQLDLRVDGTWRMGARVQVSDSTWDAQPDSGTYHVLEVALLLRSVLQPDAAPNRFTINGDSLFSANAAMVYKTTGYDVGEQIFARQR